MVTPKWACMACLLLLSLGVNSAYRVIGGQKDPKVVEKPDNFVLGGHIRGGMSLKPGFHVGGIIEGVLGLGDKRRPHSPSQSPSFGARATGVGYGGGQGGGYGGGGSCGGGQGGGSSGDQGGGNCGDQSGGDRGEQEGGIVNIPGFTIPGFDIGGIIGGGISTGSSGLFCTPIDCPSNNCRRVRLYFDNSNMAPSETTAASNGHKQTMNHGMEDKHIMNTLASEPSSSLASEPVPSSSLDSEPSNSVAPKPSDALALAPESGWAD